VLNNSGIKEEITHGIWAEYTLTATFYGNILVNLECQNLPHESIFGAKFEKLNNLKRFGEMVVVITEKKIQGKFSNRGTVCMFVGYTQNHSDYVYCLFNVKTMQVVKSRDLIFMDKDDESCVSKKQDNEIGFGDPIGDDDSDTTTNNNISKKTDLKTKLVFSNMTVFIKIKQLKRWFNSEIKGDGKLTFRKRNNVGRCKCCVLLGR
jgi:hypothetical protein